MQVGTRWDIFCTVVDNYGDIGITWRLARQLRREHGLSVRLWVDDLESFHHIQPAVRRDLETQSVEGVEIRKWASPFPADVEPASVVVEALACHLPEAYELAMAAQDAKPVWINLEYLSAENWVPGCHTLPSPHPRLPLTKYFFMPGYVAGTGGILKEAHLEAERDAFLGDTPSRNAFWRSLGVPTETSEELRISLFSYESRAIASLLRTWAAGDRQIRCLVPQGKALADVASFFGKQSALPGDAMGRGALTVQIVPMLDLDTYDRLLWASDCNFVRGEDSFVRAQWAGKPLVWQAYRQQDGAHWPKIEAFLALYCADLEADADLVLRRLWRLWNEDGEVGPAWPAFWAQHERLTAQAARWQSVLRECGDLAGNLVKFCNEKSR